MARFRDTDDGGVNLGVIITPMLDMAFQLLAFSVIAYNPSPLEGHYRVSQVLPPEKRPGFAGPKKDDKKEDLLPVPEEPKLQDVVLVSIKALTVGQAAGRQEGEIWQIYLKKPENPVPELVANSTDFPAVKKAADPNNPNKIALNLLGQELKKLKDGGMLAADIKLMPDPDLRNEHVLNVMGACRKEGFSKISFVDWDRLK